MVDQTKSGFNGKVVVQNETPLPIPALDQTEPEGILDKYDIQFDFSRVNRKWRKQWQRTQIAIERHAVLFNGIVTDSDKTDAEVFDAMDQIDALEEKQDALLSQVLCHVNRDYLIQDAPDDIDWSVVANLEYVQIQYRGVMPTMLTVALLNPAGKV